ESILIETLQIISKIISYKRADQLIAEQAKYENLRAEIWELAANKSLSENQLIQKLLDAVGPALNVSRISYVKADVMQKTDAEVFLQWYNQEQNVKSSLGFKFSHSVYQHYLEGCVELPKDANPIIRKATKFILNKFMIKSLLGIPFGPSKHRWGAITIDECIDKNKIWSESEKNILSEMVKIVETRIQQLITEENLRISEEKFRKFFDNNPEYCYMVSPEGKILEANKSSFNILGYERKELIDMPLKTIYAPESLPKMKELLNNWKETGSPVNNEEMAIITKGGEIRNVLLSVNTINDENGKILHSVSVQRDITDLKKAEEALKSITKTLHAFMNSSPDFFIILDNNLNFIKVNDSAAKLYGQPSENLVGKNLLDIVPYLKNTPRPNMYKNVIQTGTPLYLEEHIPAVLSYVSDKYFSITAFRVANGLGMIVSDITKRKQIENELREIGNIFNESQKIAFIGSWKLDLKENKLIWTDETYRQMGLKPHEIVPTYEAFEKFVHPDDLEKVNKAVKNSLKNNKPYSIEARMVRKDGTEWIMLAEGSVNIDNKGKPICFTGFQQDITDRKKSEEALRASEQQLSQIYDSVGVVLFYLAVEPDYCFRFLSINQIFLDATGLAKDQIVGKRIEEVIPGPSVLTVKDNYKKSINEKRTVRWEETSEYPSGVKIGEVSITPFFNDIGICTHLVGSVHDITDRKIAEEALKLKDRAINSSINAMLITNVNFKIDYTNPQFLSMWGYAPHENLNDFLHLWESSKNITDALTLLYSKENWIGELNAKRNDGTIFPVLLSASIVLDADKKPTNYLFSCIDITEQKHLLEELDAKNKTQEQIIYRGSHDLRNPLNSILQIAEFYKQDTVKRNSILENKDLSPEEKLALLKDFEQSVFDPNYLIDSASSSVSITDGLLQFSRLGREIYEFKTVNMDELFNSILNNFIIDLKKKNISVNLPKSIPPIKADQQKLHRAFSNLIGNAVKYYDPNKSNRTITVSYKKLKKEIEFCIEDNGLGIPKNELDNIFIIFHRAHIEDIEGEGLGLAIVKEIISNHHGKIRVESEEGVGTRFFIALPSR
ncbi:PAS domain S-box protein, partial [Candidatus Margulisiibacteriota bacterium]